MMFVDPELRERLVECHRKVGPMSQHHDFVVIDQFDVRDRIHTLKPPLLLIRGADDPGSPPEYEMEIHRAVPGSQYLKLNRAGHFPMAEKPEEFNQAIDEFLASTQVIGPETTEDSKQIRIIKRRFQQDVFWFVLGFRIIRKISQFRSFVYHLALFATLACSRRFRSACRASVR